MATATAGACGCSALGGCDTTSGDALEYRGGTVEDGFYMTSSWSGPLVAFPGGRRYDLVHGLGCRPRDIDIWVSFSEQGAAPDSNIAQSAGNMAIVETIDDQIIRIKNDTCSDMYLLVTAGGCTAEDGGAPGDAQ